MKHQDSALVTIMLDGRKSYNMRAKHYSRSDDQSLCLSCEIGLTLLEITEGGMCTECAKRSREFEKRNKRLLK